VACRATSVMDADSTIKQCLSEGRSFVLDAGAGAGKTYSLVVALQESLEMLGTSLRATGQQIACITFTNVAKDEVVGRTSNNPLIRVSTIHEFLWHVVQGHQAALKRAVLKVNEQLKADSARKKDSGDLAKALDGVAITYSDTGSNFLEGRLFHDDLILVAAAMFQDNPLLARIVAAKFPLILMDEYQDADPKVIEFLITRVIPQNRGAVTVGLFGDKFQSIYDGGVGELPSYATAELQSVIKPDNRRCSLAVIDVLNRLRTDIQQIPAHQNAKGDAVYVRIASPDETSMVRVREYLRTERGWNTTNAEWKELYLTHRLIARKGGYEQLLRAFDERGGFYRDRMLRGEDSCVAFFLDQLEPLAAAWTEGFTGKALALLRRSGFTLTSPTSKASIARNLDQLVTLRKSADVRSVLGHVQQHGLGTLPDELASRLLGQSQGKTATQEETEREERAVRFFEALFSTPYAEVSAFNAFFREHTPFTTKHGVKGAEYDTVMVVLDDKGARWNTYSFDKYLSREDEHANASRFRRTRNLFYVCCSRAKRNLAVVDFGASTKAKQTGIETIFGAANCAVV
jgi:ATP-dependent DNA helicase UvrD/PcrA